VNDYEGDLREQPELAQTLIKRAIGRYHKRYGFKTLQPEGASCYAARFYTGRMEHFDTGYGIASMHKYRWCIHIGCHRGTLAVYRIKEKDGCHSLVEVRIRNRAVPPEEAINFTP
jgi:hypothetical protein